MYHRYHTLSSRDINRDIFASTFSPHTNYVFIVPSSNLFPKSLMCHARSTWWLETKSYARIVPPPPRFTRQPQKEKMFLAFRICARPVFSENGKGIFLFGVLPSKYSGSVAGLQFGLGFAKTIFWGYGFSQNRD